MPGPTATCSNMPQPNKDSSVDHRPPPPPPLSPRGRPTSYRSGRSPRGRSLSSRPLRTPPYRLLLLSAQPSRYSVQDRNIAPDIPKSWHCSRSPRGAWEVVQLALLRRSIRFRAGTHGHMLQHASAQQGLLCGPPSSSSASVLETLTYVPQVRTFSQRSFSVLQTYEDTSISSSTPQCPTFQIFCPGYKHCSGYTQIVALLKVTSWSVGGRTARPPP